MAARFVIRQAYFLVKPWSRVSGEFKKLWRLLQRKCHIKIERCVRLSVSRFGIGLNDADNWEFGELKISVWMSPVKASWFYPCFCRYWRSAACWHLTQLSNGFLFSPLCNYKVIIKVTIIPLARVGYLTIRLRARVSYEQIVNEAQPSWLSLVENSGE